MEYDVYVKKLNPHIEEEAILEILGFEFTAFLTIYSY